MMTLTSLGTALAQEPANDWRLSLGFRESNQYKLVTNDVARDDRVIDNANASIGFATRTEHSRFSLFGRLGSDFYRKGEQRDRLNYGGGIAWTRQASPRFNLRLSQNVNRGLTLSTLSTIGVLDRNLSTLSANTSLGMRYQTSPRTTISTGLNYTYIKWNSPQDIEGSQIVLEQDPFVNELPTPRIEAAPEGELQVPDAEHAALGILATEGLRSGESQTHWGTVVFGVQTQLSERTAIGFDVSGAYRRIEYPGRRREGSEGAFRVWTQRAIGRTSNVLANYQVRRSLVLQPTTTIQSASGGFSYSPEEKDLTLRLQGGASYYQAEGSPSQLTPIADVAFSAGLTRSTRFAASYRRRFSNAIGLGRTLLIDYANVSVTQGVGSRLDLSALAGGSLGRDPLEEGSELNAFRYGGTVRFRPLQSLTLGTSFFVAETERVSRGFNNNTQRNLWSFFITYSTSWH